MLLVGHGIARCPVLCESSMHAAEVTLADMSDQPHLSHTAIACVLLKHHDPAQRADTLLQSVDKDMYSCRQLSWSRRGTGALGDAGASAAEAAGRGAADAGPQGPHSYP